MPYEFVIHSRFDKKIKKRLNRLKWKKNPIIGKTHRIPSIMEKIKKSVNPKEITN